MRSKARVFWLHYNRFGQKRGEKVWTVHMSDRCIQTKKVFCHAPVESVYKGDSAPQPRAFYKGKGIVRVYRNHVRIDPPA